MSSEWNLARLQKLVDDKEQERFDLEFKACDALRWNGNNNLKAKRIEELSRDISAMVNAAGGAIIYGIAENNSTRTLDTQPFSSSDVSKEWLDQVIRSNISPAPEVRVIPVHIDDDTSKDWYYVLELEQGITAHQAKDLLFWRRNNTTKERMRQFEIADVMNRTKGPVLDAKITIKTVGTGPKQCQYDVPQPGGGSVQAFRPLSINQLTLEVTTRNFISADHGVMRLYSFFPVHILETTASPIVDSSVVGDEGRTAQVKIIDYLWSIYQGTGIYPGRWTGMPGITIGLPVIIPERPPLHLIKIELNGPNTPLRSSWFSITRTPQWSLSLVNAPVAEEITSHFCQTYDDCWVAYADLWNHDASEITIAD